MEKLNEHRNITPEIDGSLLKISFKFSRRSVTIATLCAIPTLVVGSYFLVNYPLETTIVVLLMGSVFSMRRG